MGLFIINYRRIFLEEFVASFSHRPLKSNYGLGIIEVILFVFPAAKPMEACAFKTCINRKTHRVKGSVMTEEDAF